VGTSGGGGPKVPVRSDRASSVAAVTEDERGDHLVLRQRFGDVETTRSSSGWSRIGREALKNASGIPSMLEVARRAEAAACPARHTTTPGTQG